MRRRDKTVTEHVQYIRFVRLTEPQHVCIISFVSVGIRTG